MNRRSRSIVALALAIGLGGAGATGAGCAHAPAPLLQRPHPAPSADELLHQLAARQAAVSSMNAKVRATSWIGSERLRATVLMLVERSGRLRFEAEVSLQGTVAILTADGDRRFQLLDVRKNQLQEGPACPANVASLIRIRLEPSEVAAILLGDVKLPASSLSTPATVGWDGARRADVLTVKDGDRELRLYFRQQGGDRDLIGVAAFAPGGRLWETSYENFEGAAGARAPALIRFAEGTGSFDDGVEIKVKDRQPNPQPHPTDFTIAPPAGTPVVEVGCGPGPK